MRWFLVATATVLSVTTWAGSAHAAEPHYTVATLGGQQAPGLAVDENGVAHVAWDDRYCRVIRNGRSCASTRKVNFSDPGIAHVSFYDGRDTNGPRVLQRGDRLLLLRTLCCQEAWRRGSGSKGRGSTVKLILVESRDGGKTFRAPLQIGTNPVSGAAAMVGVDSIITVSNQSFGVRLQVSPTTDYELVKCFGGSRDLPYLPDDEHKHLGWMGEIPCYGLEDTVNISTVKGGTGGDDLEGWFSGSVAFVDKLTPLVVYQGNEAPRIPPDPMATGHIIFSRWTGGALTNRDTGWSRPVDTGIRGDQPRLAGLSDDKKGIFVLYRKRLGSSTWQYVVRRWNDKARSFGPEAPVTEKGFPVFADVTMDAGGRLHVAWKDADHALRYRASKPGGGWGPIVVLGTRAQSRGGYQDIRVAAAPDGGGIVVWKTIDGAVRAVQFGPRGAVGDGGSTDVGDCVEQVTVGLAVVEAKEGCLKRVGDRYTAAGDVRVNGVDVDAPAGSVVVDKGDRTLITAGPVTARAGNIVLGKEKLAWRLPSAAAAIGDLVAVGNPATFGTGAFGTSLLGLAVSGYTTIRLTAPGKAEIPVNLALPSPFSSLLGDTATGSVLLRTSNADGLELNGLRIKITGVWIGIAEIEEFEIVYVGDPSLVRGSTSILLPVSGAKLGAEFQLRAGDFDYGKASLEFTNPGQLPVATDVLLKKIAFEVQKGSSCGTPTKIGGSVTLAIGPTIGSLALISAVGNVSYAFPQGSCNLPGVLAASVDGAFLSIPVVHAEVKFTTDLVLTFLVHVGIEIPDIASLSVDLEGGVDIPNAQFYAKGDASLDLFGTGVLGLEAIVSNVGMAACGQLTPVLAFGFAYPWGELFGPSHIDSPPFCDVDLDAYKPAAFSSRMGPPQTLGRSAVTATRTFTLRDGLPHAEIRLDGSAAAPGFVLTGPNGLRIEHTGEGAATAQGSNSAVYASAAENRTYVGLVRPAPGQYVVTDGAGPPIAAALVADGLAEANVKGTVRRVAGGRFDLRYTIAPRPGQLVRFVEDGVDVRNVVAVTRASSGSIRFSPTAGPPGRRTISAIVESRGMPRAMIKVATFQVARQGLGAPARVRLVRRGTTAVVTWRRATGASRHVVAYALRDGRRGAVVVRGTRFVLRGVPGIDSGTIRVAGLGRDGRPGSVVRMALKAKPLKSKPKQTPKPSKRG